MMTLNLTGIGDNHVTFQYLICSDVGCVTCSPPTILSLNRSAWEQMGKPRAIRMRSTQSTHDDPVGEFTVVVDDD